ncbi:MAG: hypothetical protein KQA33_00855 [Candidatus Aenigmarchaeota archaeon]|nr:hypothetical protein [Candidatus Aenigmarchaeota archaeon]
MRTYVKFHFSSEGASPLEIIRKVRERGWAPEVGQYDASKEFTKEEEYLNIVTELHEILKGTGTLYKLITKER